MDRPAEHGRWSNEPTVALRPVETSDPEAANDPTVAMRPGGPPGPETVNAPTVAMRPGGPPGPDAANAPTVALRPGNTPALAAANAPTVLLPLVTPAPQVVTDAPLVEQGAPPPSPPQDDSTGSVVRNSSTMAILSLVSRGTGFLRTAAIGAAIGGAVVGDDYTLANNLPNQVYELLLGGILASVLIPTLVRARKEDGDRGQAYAQRLLTLAVVAIGGATVVVTLAAPLLTAVLTLGSDKVTHADRDLITVLAYLLLPEIFFYGLAGIFAAILNVRGHFAAPMWTPILNNVVILATAGTFWLVSDGAPRPDTITLTQVLILGGGTTAGIVIQALGLWPAMRRVGFQWKWRWDFRKLHLRELARLGAWMLLYVGVNQVGITVVLALAKNTQLRGGSGPIIYNSAFLIFMMAHGIVAVSVITAMMPRISAAAADGRFGDITEQLSQGTRLAAVVLIPAAALYIVLGQPLAVTLFEWSSYSHREALATGWVVTAAGLGLVPFAVSQMQTSVFYALRDTKTPALINVGIVGIRLVIDVAFFFVLPIAAVTASLMLGTAISFIAALFIGYWLLRRRLGRLGLARIADTLIRLGIAAGAGAVLAFAVSWVIGRVIENGKLAGAVQLITGGGVLLTVYVVVAVLLRVPEVKQFGGLIKNKLGR